MVMKPKFMIIAASVLIAGYTASAEVRGAEIKSYVSGGAEIHLNIEKLGKVGDRARISFNLRDPTTHMPITGARLAAWFMPEKQQAEPSEAGCSAKISALLQAGDSWRGNASLNRFVLVAMARDAVLRILNPQASFGGSRLERVVALPGVPFSWSIANDRKHLALTFREQPGISIVDLQSFDVAPLLTRANLPAANPIYFGGKDGLIWSSSKNKILGIDQISGDRKFEFALAGMGDVHFSPNSDGEKFLAYRQGGTQVLLINSFGHSNPAVMDMGSPMVTAAWSAAANSFYAVSDKGDLIALSGSATHIANVASAEGLFFSKDGRFGFVLSKSGAVITAFDTASNRLIEAVALSSGASRVIFSDAFAYAISENGRTATLFDLASLQSQQLTPLEVQLASLPRASGVPHGALSSAVISPEGNAAFVANPDAGVITYYVEGMMAPSATISATVSGVRDILIADSGLRETAPGQYSAETEIRQGGKIMVPVVVDQPRLTHCFITSVDSAQNGASDSLQAVQILPIGKMDLVAASSDLNLRFQLLDANARALQESGHTIQARLIEQTGGWTAKRTLVTDQHGTFQMKVFLPQPGIYFVSFRLPDLGLDWGRVHATKISAR
jgi:hypothetical protein